MHTLGLYRSLLPIHQPQPTEFIRRLQSYLNHYYEHVDHAEANLYLGALGLRFACDIKDHMLWWHLQGLAPIYEQLEINHCIKQVRPRDHIVDVGANHGFWGFSLAYRAGEGARLYLAEANPTIIRRLRRTARMNPRIDARILPFAVSDGSADSLTFYLPADTLSGLGSTVLHEYAVEQGYLQKNHQIVVPAKSLDSLVEDATIEGIDMMKVDVEQGEDAVVRGALRALERYPPRMVMMETSIDGWASNALIEMGYATYRLDETGCEKPVEPGFWGNIFFALK